MTSDSQKKMILRHLKTHVGLTPDVAYSKYGIYRLAARIHDLRADGHNIVTLTRETVNQFGDPCSYAEYRLVKGLRK